MYWMKKNFYHVNVIVRSLCGPFFLQKLDGIQWVVICTCIDRFHCTQMAKMCILFCVHKDVHVLKAQCCCTKSEVYVFRVPVGLIIQSWLLVAKNRQ